MGILKKIVHSVFVAILTVNIAVFGYIAWPEGSSAVDLAHSGMPVVVRAAEDVITSGDIYELDVDRGIIKAIVDLDALVYSRYVGHLVVIHPTWKVYVVTGDLARKISDESHSYAFTDSISHVVVFLAVGGADPMQIIAHEFTHVLQSEDGGRIMAIPRLAAEYEAEVISRTTVGFLYDLSLPATYPVHHISKIEKLQVRKYLAESNL